MKYAEQFLQETQALHHRRVYYIIVVGVAVMLLFSMLDYVLVPLLFQEFFIYRIIICVVGALLLVANFRDQDKRKSFIIGFLGYQCVGLMVLVMMLRMGGVASPYYVGLIVTMTIYTTIAPLTAVQAIVAGFSLIVCYCVTVIGFSNGLESQWLEFYNELFFLVCFVFIVATQSWADTASRRREFVLRMEEHELTGEINQQANKLELEVVKRTEEQKVLEERYRLLFNRMADSVVLLSEDGNILQANASFEEHFQSDLAKERSFCSLVKKEDLEDVNNNLMDLIQKGCAVSAFQVALLGKKRDYIDTEISGILLYRNGEKVGSQLVIRDITVRKILKRQLIESLRRVKQTESATILALAKLSEYRENSHGKHLERIREYCRILGTQLSQKEELQGLITPNYLHDIFHASILHDIGKVSIPDVILLKLSSLTEQEEEVLRQHTMVGGDLIKSMEEGNKKSGFLSMAKVIAYFHHEKWDGTGYPHGLKEREIPLAARIMSVVDAYEEMTAQPETQPHSHLEAVQRIISETGSSFDPMIVECFQATLAEFDVIRETFVDNKKEADYP